jgi:hypothetical protein
MRTPHSHMALGSLSIMHSTTTTHTLPYQQSLPRMACAAWVVLLHNSLLLPHHVACADNFVAPRPQNLIHPTTREYMFEGGPVRVCDDVWGRY